jgi:hypothetical protein
VAGATLIGRIRIGSPILAAVPSDFDPSPLPFVLLMALGFLVGTIGHVYRSNTLIATGIGLITVATLLLPVGLYLASR